MSEPEIKVALTTESCAPRIKDAQIAERYLPKWGEHPITTHVIIRGINNTTANGLRRILLTEMENLALQLDDDSWESDDPFAMVDMIKQRVALIPLVQHSVRAGDEYALTFANDTDEPMDVMSVHLKPKGVARDSRERLAQMTHAFFETICIITLQPHRRIKFSARVVRGNGAQDAAFATASAAVAIPLDERPEAERGIATALPLEPDVQYRESVSTSNPRVYLVRFESCGKGNSREIMARATSTFIERMLAIKDAQVIDGPAQLSHARDHAADVYEHGTYHLRIANETYTIGEMFVKCALTVFPHLNFAACTVDDLKSELIIRIFTRQDNVHDVIARTVDYAVTMLRAILRYF